MKVLQLCNKAPYPPRDGGAHASWALARGLCENGIDVTLLYMNTSKHRISEPEVPKNLRSLLHTRGVHVNTTICPLAAIWNLLFSHLPYNLVRFSSGPFRKQLSHLLTHQKFDAIIFDGLPLTLYLPLLQYLPETTKILRAHNVEHRIWEGLAKTESFTIRKWYLGNLSYRMKKYEMATIQKMDALLPISRADEKYFQKGGFAKPTFLYPFGIDPELHIPKKEKKHITPNLLFLGALDWIPNTQGLQWFLKEVWPAIHKKYPKMSFHIAGRNPGHKIKWLSNQPSIKFYGEIEDIDEFTRHGDLFVIPLFTGSGMRIKIIEAMARGLIVITTTKGLEGIGAKPGKQ